MAASPTGHSTRVNWVDLSCKGQSYEIQIAIMLIHISSPTFGKAGTEQVVFNLPASGDIVG
jgi:hypothetical protein